MATPRKEMTPDKKDSILQLYKSGMKKSKIAELLGINYSTVLKFIKRFEERGSSGNKTRSGRPPKMDDRSCRILNRSIREDRSATLVDITNKFNNQNHVQVCKRTIQRALYKFDYKKRSIRKKLGVRAVNRLRRVHWCRTHLTWTVQNNWRTVIFSDEMKVVVSGTGLVKVWRTRGEAYRPECLGYVKPYCGKQLTMMVWGCITYYGVGTLVFVNGNMNSEKYIEVLDNNLWPVIVKHFPNEGCLFQDDNAPCHASHATKAWKERNQLSCLPWPAQSPDINIIENIWLLIKNHVKRNISNINSTEDLKSVLIAAWNSVTILYIQNLYRSIPRRLQKVIRSKGHITKY